MRSASGSQPTPRATSTSQVTGALVATFTDTATGRSVTYNISGPAKNSIAYANGDFLLVATGRNLGILTAEQSATLGLPELFVTSGPIRVLIRADGTVEIQRQGNHLQDISRRLPDNDRAGFTERGESSFPSPSRGSRNCTMPRRYASFLR